VKINRQYIFFVLTLVIIFVLMLVAQPRYFNWFTTLHYNDKNPFGAYVLNELLTDRFPDFSHSYLSVYELAEEKELEPGDNLFILAQTFTPDSLESVKLLQMMASGVNVLIGTSSFTGYLADTAGFEVQYRYGSSFMPIDLSRDKQDSIALHFVNPDLAKGEAYYFPEPVIKSEVSLNRTDNLVKILESGEEAILGISRKFGKGEMIMTASPLLFTNYSLLYRNNSEVAAKLMAYLGKGRLHWTEYYQTGRYESASPLRYFLSQPPLQWATYLALFTIVLFMVFEAKRKQRIIPIIDPPENATLSFTKTIARLYYQKSNHRDLAWKKIVHFHEYAMRTYFVDVFESSPQLAERLSGKMEVSKKKARQLIEIVRQVRNARSISKRELKQVNDLIDHFYENQ